MAGPTIGLHHVTATVDDAQDDLDFCVGTLGLRLVKRTVNFDNHSVYHFYYGDRQGTPGTIWTTFPYKGHGVPAGRKGAGQIVTTAFSVPHGSLAFWRARLAHASIAVTDIEERHGEAAIAFTDQCGLDFEIVGSAHDSRPPWVVDGIDASVAIRGLHSVTLVVREAGPTLALMAQLGWHATTEEGARIRTVIGHGGPGRTIDVVVDADRAPGVNGIGTVHHVAMSIATSAEQQSLREALLAQGYRVTDIRDRTYFKSIYFREPGGVLFEVATLDPGFTFDETPAALGTALKLPSWEEPHRVDIERALPSVRIPRL